jgi:hypothetical protein
MVRLDCGDGRRMHSTSCFDSRKYVVVSMICASFSLSGYITQRKWSDIQTCNMSDHITSISIRMLPLP